MTCLSLLTPSHTLTHQDSFSLHLSGLDRRPEGRIRTLPLPPSFSFSPISHPHTLSHIRLLSHFICQAKTNREHSHLTPSLVSPLSVMFLTHLSRSDRQQAGEFAPQHNPPTSLSSPPRFQRRGSRNQGSRYQGPDVRVQIPGSRYQGSDTRVQIPGPRYLGPDIRAQIPGSRDRGPDIRV